MKMKFKELNEKRKLILSIYGKSLQDKPSKLSYALQKWDKIATSVLSEIQKEFTEKFNEAKSEIEINLAEEKDGVLLVDDKGNFKYSKANEKERIKQLTKLAKETDEEINSTEVEFEPYLIEAEVIKETDEFIIEELKNIFIK